MPLFSNFKIRKPIYIDYIHIYYLFQKHFYYFQKKKRKKEKKTKATSKMSYDVETCIINLKSKLKTLHKVIKQKLFKKNIYSQLIDNKKYLKCQKPLIEKVKNEIP